jgi:hypothetical protein
MEERKEQETKSWLRVAGGGRKIAAKGDRMIS